MKHQFPRLVFQFFKPIMQLASIQTILAVEKHPNADALDIVRVKGFRAIVKRDQWKVGDLIIFIEPDTVLPDAPWAAFYKSKSSRVKAIKLRNVWSEGIVESTANIGYTGPMTPGLDVAEVIGVRKYEPPIPQDLSAKGNLPFGIPKTDEERIESLESPPWGELCDLYQKIDGQSCSFYVKIGDDTIEEGVLGRTLEYKLECHNAYTQNQANLDILNRLRRFCIDHKVSLCLRGEQYGHGIQKMSINPHCSHNLGWAMFSVYLIDERRYARKGDPYYFPLVAEKLKLPTVPLVKADVPLTPELVKHYAEDCLELNGKPFEGVVAQWREGSFKILSKYYDSKK
jgi:RNA ligase (TIGR02306 family)